MKEADAIKLFKCLADQSRLQILKSLLQEDMYVERLAGRLALTPATISFHLKKLEDAGAVSSRKEQYYTMYSIRREVFSTRIIDIICQQSSQADAQAQRKKECICLEEIASHFALGKVYDEKQVNAIIGEIFDDYCTLRRDMIAEGIFMRDGRSYTRVK